jgi:hypothetical protein
LLGESGYPPLREMNLPLVDLVLWAGGLVRSGFDLADVNESCVCLLCLKSRALKDSRSRNNWGLG